jgi:hypothetical protein
MFVVCHFLLRRAFLFRSRCKCICKKEKKEKKKKRKKRKKEKAYIDHWRPQPKVKAQQGCANTLIGCNITRIK